MIHLLRELVIVPVRLYRYLISPLWGSSCRFHPTCSAYTIEALRRHGVLKGLFLGLSRIGHCHPWCRTHWHDPVPKSFCWGLRRGGSSAINAEQKSQKPS